MYGAYVDLMADRDLIMVQVHAQSASDIPEVRDAVRRGLAKLVESVRERSGATDAEVQRIVAFAMLCQLIVAVDLQGVRHRVGADPDRRDPQPRGAGGGGG